MHLSDDHILRWLHGETSSTEAEATRAHLADCAQCRARLEEVQREEEAVHALLHTLDHPMPRADAEAVAARARAGAGAGGTSEWMRRAAVVLAAIGVVGAAYAIPGSPLRAWVDAARQRLAPLASEDRGKGSATDGDAGGAPDEIATSGIAIAPGANLVIEIVGASAGGRVLVTLGDGSEVVVRGPANTATYASTADRLVIRLREGAAAGPPAGDLTIEIPRSAPRVEIVGGAARLFLKDGSRVESATTPDSRGAYALPLPLESPSR